VYYYYEEIIIYINFERKIMNIKQIAEIVGYSSSTVSRVLSDKDGNVPISQVTKDKILKACKEYGYKPNVHASRFFSKRSQNIGILMPQALYLSDRNLSRFMDGAYRAIEANNYRMTVFSASEKFIKEKNHLNIFKTKEVDGLLIWGCSEQDKFIDELKAENYPFILGNNRKGNYPTVICDDFYGMAKLVNHCKDKACERFMYISTGNYDASHRRCEGFIQATKDCTTTRMDFDRDHVFRPEDISAIMQFKPDVIMCLNDITAYNITSQLKKQNISVPQDVLVTGADNTEFSNMVSPTITTYDQMAETCGQRAIEILIDHLDNAKPLKSAAIKPQLKIRESA
jgi:DNA-binding LacI/PurR family transcriptional regulator